MDLDIDLKTSFNPQVVFNTAVQASMIKNDELVKHPCGFYFQNIAVDNITGLSAIPYEEANILGYFKVDFLHLSLLDSIKSKQEVRDLANKEPNWDLLLDKDIVSKLFHVHRHYNLLLQLNPRSVQELADVIALIRPGKRHLLNEYLTNKQATRPKLYRGAMDDKSSFKRGHAIAYALNVVLQLNMIEQHT